jgi:putative lipoic acid-binding regulatory protein
MSDFTKLQSLLEEQMQFPDYYTFKFIAKEHNKDQLLEVLDEHKISLRESKGGKYTSVTSRKLVKTSHEVIEIYKEIGKIEGILTL